MKNTIVLLLFILPGCYVSHNPVKEEARLLKAGKLGTDSSYIYALPFKEGKCYRLIQGYFSQFTHKERAALDFNMKRGAEVHAARDGVVVRIKKDGIKGGLKDRFRSEGNHVVIQHSDGSRAGYWHLQHNNVFVNPGDSVKRGQLIGLSGKTGYAIIPHLHFLVWNYHDGKWQAVPTRFETDKGVKYLSFWKCYRSISGQ